MKAEELKTKTPDELTKLLVDLKKEQFNLRFQSSQGQLENTAKVRNVRRDIARVKTFLNVDASASAKPAKKEAAKKTTKTATKTSKAQAKDKPKNTPKKKSEDAA